MKLEVVRRHAGLTMEVVEETDAADNDPSVGRLERTGHAEARVHPPSRGLNRRLDRADLRDRSRVWHPGSARPAGPIGQHEVIVAFRFADIFDEPRVDAIGRELHGRTATGLRS